MRRDNGAHIALGALAALTALGALVQGRGSRAKGSSGETQARQAKIRRALKRAADQMDGWLEPLRTISEETGFSESELEAEAKILAESGGYYLEMGEDTVSEWLGIGKVHPLRQKLIAILNRNMESNPELGVRTVDLVVRLMPDSESLSAEDNLRSSRRYLEQQIRDSALELGYPPPRPGDEMKLYAKVYADGLRNRTLFNTGDPYEYNLDAMAVHFRGLRYLSWLESAMRRALDNNPGEPPIELTLDLIHFWPEIVDWASAERVDLGGMWLEDVVAAQMEWHRAQGIDAVAIANERVMKGWFECLDGRHPIKGPTIYQHQNGWTWQELDSWEALQYEGNLTKGGGCLRHCIGENKSYHDEAQAGKRRHFSLRTTENRPMLTASISYSNGRPVSLDQIRGLQNREAGSPGLGGEMVAVLRRAGELGLAGEQAYLDAEALMVDEFLKFQGVRRENAHQLRFVSARLDQIERGRRAIGRENGNANRGRRPSSGSRR